MTEETAETELRTTADADEVLPETEIDEDSTSVEIVETESDAAIEIETEIETEAETEAAVEETEEAVEIESETAAETESEEAVETETESETELPAIEVETETETEEPEEHFLNDENEYHFSGDFSSMRLIVMAADKDAIIDPEHLIGNYGDIWLLQYSSEKQAMSAYAYYRKHASAVEPDAPVSAADGEAVEDQSLIDSNPLAALADAPASADAPSAVIALLDTGTSSASGNVIGRVSLIDESLSGNGHADAMLEAILSQNPDARVISVRVMNDAGKGSTASVVAGIEYALEQGASIINLSLYSRKTIATSVLAAEIERAVSAGAVVVGAAGNSGSDASGFMPGAVGSAWIVGSCDETGTPISSSNTGSTVDLYAVSESTSVAAAMFSGRISLTGTSAIEAAGPTFFIPGAVVEEETEEGIDVEDESEDETDAEEQASPDGYPGNGETEEFCESVWIRDKYYDFSAYNPYRDDENVSTEMKEHEEVDFSALSVGDELEFEYVHRLNDDPERTWESKTIFEIVKVLSEATVESDKASLMLPDWIPADGSILPLPEFAGETIDGLSYAVPQGDEDFSLEMLNNGYDVKKFRTWVEDDGGFDVNVLGKYDVTYKASYFMDPDREWLVRSSVEVVPALEGVNVIRNASDSIKVTLNGETDVPFGIKVPLESDEFEIAVKAYDENMLNEIDPSVTVEMNGVDVSEEAVIEKEERKGSAEFRVKLPEKDGVLTVIVKDEANGLVYDGKNSYSGNWRPIDADDVDYSDLTAEEMADLEAYYGGEFDVEDDVLEFGEDEFYAAAKTKLSSKTWKQSSSLKLFVYNGMRSADYNNTHKWYHAIRVKITSAIAAKMKTYVANNCKKIYWSDKLQKKFNAKLDKYVNDYLMRLVCTANDYQHGTYELHGWYDVDAKHFLKIVSGSNVPKISISGTYKTKDLGGGKTQHAWTFKVKGTVNPDMGYSSGVRHQTFAGSKSFTIKETDTDTYPVSVTKVNSDASTPAHLVAYQNLSATFYICTNGQKPKETVVSDGILTVDSDGSTDDSVGDLDPNTTYYCWEDPESTVNYTATKNPVAFNNPSKLDELEIPFPNSPVKMNITARKVPTSTDITEGNRLYSLAGIPFTIWSAAQGTVSTPVTDATGAWTVNGLWKDNYVVQEKPGGGYGKGYRTNVAGFPVNYQNGNTVITYTVSPIEEVPVYATPGVIMQKMTTAAANNASFAGAVFRFDYYDAYLSTDIVNDLKQDLASERVFRSWTETSAADGTVRVEHSPFTDLKNPANNGKIVPIGTLVVTEESSPTNGKYYLNSLQKMFVIRQNGENATISSFNILHNDSFEKSGNPQSQESIKATTDSIISVVPTSSYQMEESPSYGRVILRKADWDADEIESPEKDGDMTGDAEYDGTTFGIYVEDASDGYAHREDNWQSVSYGKDALIDTVTVVDGIAETNVRLQAGFRYYIKELSETDGYLRNDAVYHFTIRKDAYVDAVTDAVVDPTEFKNRGTGSGKSVKDLGADPFRNRPKHGGVHVNKYDLMRDTNHDHADADLKGAKFVIVNASKYRARNKDGVLVPTSGLDRNGNVTYNQVLQFAESSKMQEIFSDTDGYAETGKTDLPYGTYYVIETEAPKGYQVNEAWVGMVVVREHEKLYPVKTVAGGDHDEYNHDYYGTWFDFGADGYAVRDQIYRSGISLVKIDKEMHSTVRQGDATLNGAEFTIVNASLASARNKDGFDIETAKDLLPAVPTWKDVKAVVDRSKEPEAKYGGNAGSGCYVMQVIKSDEQGHAKTGRYDLPYGTYYVIETKASYGYFLDDKFVGKIVVRDDGLLLTPGDFTESGDWVVSEDTEAGSSFHDVNDGTTEFATTVDQQVRRSDVKFIKTTADGEYKKHIPFLISAIRMDDEGNETVIERHAVLADENGFVTTASSIEGVEGEEAGRPHSNNTNRLDDYVDMDTMILNEEKLESEIGPNWREEVCDWGVWFQGDGNVDRGDLDVVDEFGALYPGYYRMAEMKCSDNDKFRENLIASLKPVYVYNSVVDLTVPMTSNAKVQNLYPFSSPDHEIEASSVATDVESGTKTVPARDSVEVTDTVTFRKITADHKYRVETQFIDVTDGNRELKIQKTDDPDAYLSDDGLWVCKEFDVKPGGISGNLNTSESTQTMSAWINTKSLNGHTILAVEYLYECVDLTNSDAVPGAWTLVKVHPDEAMEGTEAYDAEFATQSLYVPDLHTTATDSLTGDREAAKSASDSVLDSVAYMNLSDHEEYVIVMKVVNAETGEAMTKNGDDSDLTVSSRVLFERPGTPMSGTLELPAYPIDSSGFEEDVTAVVIEELYRADSKTKEPMGEPILVHDSLLDEDQTIRWPDVHTTALDEKTLDDVGTYGEERIVYDDVLLENVVFDDDDHENGYVYKVKGRLVYQKDFVDADGTEHKEGDPVEILDGTQDVVLISSDAAGNASFRYEDGTEAEGSILTRTHGYNVAKRVNGGEADNAYVKDPHSLICNVKVRLQFKVNASALEGGSVVAFERLYHDAAGACEVELDEHEEINDEGQTVHFPKVRTSAVDSATADDVGALRENAVITDTVALTNLVPGKEYLVSGTLKDRDTGEDFLVNGRKVVRTATVRATEDGKIESGNGEKTTVTAFNAEKHEVSGTVDLTFEFDARNLENRTTVVFEDLIHDSVKVAVHNDLKDNGQTIRFPKIRTTAEDKATEDRVAPVSKTETVVDHVKYVNLVIGREYTVKGVLMNKKTGEPLLDAEGNEIRAERTFTAGDEEDGLVVSERDDEALQVSGEAVITFTFDSSLLEGETAVAFETLLHKKIEVAAHADIEDKDQTIHWPKIRTSALEGAVGDEVGENAVTTIVDTVRLWNLLPGKTYEVSGKLMDKDTGKPFLTSEGKEVTATAEIEVGEDGTLTAVGGERTEVIKYDEKNECLDGTVDLTFEVDASELESRTLVAFEKLLHKKKEVAVHEDVRDLAQTIHFPKIATTAADAETKDEVGKVSADAVIVDAVTYENLVIGKNYRLEGTLYYQDTGKPVIAENGAEVTSAAEFKATKEGSEENSVTAYDDEKKTVSGVYRLTFRLSSALLEGRTTVVFEDLYHNKIRVATHSDITDLGQSTHYPKIGTTAVDSATKDNVSAVKKEETIVDKVELKNLVPGKTYKVSGILYDKATGEPLLDAEGNEIKGETEFKAEEGDGFEVTALDEAKGMIDGIVEVVFTFDSSLLEGKTLVAFEKLHHNGIEVAVHEEIEDEPQTLYFPKVRTSAVDGLTKDEVGTTAETTIVDTVMLWNLVPGMKYVVSGTLMDKDTGEEILINGEKVTASAEVIVGEHGTIDGGDGERTTVTRKPTKSDRSVDGTIDLTFRLEASSLVNKTTVAFEELLHNGIRIAAHADLSDMEQTIHYPEIRTHATDADTASHAGTVKTKAIIKDVVTYRNLVVGKTYTLNGTLMNRETGNPILDEEGKLIEASAMFTAGDEEEGVNRITNRYEEDNEVDGEYVLEFAVDSTILQGSTVVVFEDLTHNGVKVATHADLEDEDQSVHYPKIRTFASDVETADHAGDVTGALMNGPKQTVGGDDEKSLAVLTDVVKLDNLAPGHTYVVAGKLYDADASRNAGEPIVLLVNGKEITQKATITVSEDGLSITAKNGEKTEVTEFDGIGTDGTVELKFEFDSSLVQGVKTVVFEKLYQDASYGPDTEDENEEDLINEHSDYEDEDQSVSEVEVSTTAVDASTGGHVGRVPDGETSTIRDSVHMAKLVPGMEYEIRGVLVELNESDLNNKKPMYFKADGTLTPNRDEAYEEVLTFKAKDDVETHELAFAVASDKVQGMTLTVFESLYHAEVMIASHPSYNEEAEWDEKDFASQTVYYPTGKTNAEDDVTQTHASLAAESRTITDRVYFEDLLCGEEYEVKGDLVYRESFEDADGTAHEAGEVLTSKTVRFKASAGLSGAEYSDGSGTTTIDGLETKALITGQTVISGYVSIVFEVDASKLAGATLVAFETFRNRDVDVFVHADLNDAPQTIRIPKLATTAKTEDLDETAVFDEDGNAREITIVDEVRYENLWTQAELDEMREIAKRIRYADGSERPGADLYDVSEKATYVIKGILIDKDTGEPLKNNYGGIYEAVSEPFSPESGSGAVNVEFVIDASDFMDENGECRLEGMTAVAFEDLYMTDGTDEDKDLTEANRIGEHRDIDDEEQDIRFPKGRTHATDGTDAKTPEGSQETGYDEGLDAVHAGEATTTDHEILAGSEMTVTDMVSYSNLHGGTTYSVKGVLQVVTAYGEDGRPSAWEPAKDDEGNEITAEAVLDTSKFSTDYDARVSGFVPITFTFSGLNLMGERLVAFEEVLRDGRPVIVHADIEDAPQTIFVPLIHTDDSEAFSGIDETLAADGVLIRDVVVYKNLEAGKTYAVKASMRRKADGSVIEGSEVEGFFTAGAENQWITKDGTKLIGEDDARRMLEADGSLAAAPNAEFGSEKGDFMNRVNGEVSVLMPVDAADAEGTTYVAFESLYAETDEGDLKKVAEHENLDDEDQDVKFPKIRTKAGLTYENVEEGTLFIEDSVSYWNLTPGREYEMRGKLIDKETGASTEISAMTPFIPETPSGKTIVTFAIGRDEYAGKTLVAFEELVTKDRFGNDRITAKHEDLNDAEQTVPIPRIGTKAALTGTAALTKDGMQLIEDTVSFENLTPGMEYVMRGVLMRRTGSGYEVESTGVVGETKFVPDAPNGTVKVPFTFKADKYAGEYLVVYERLTCGTNAENETTTVAVHEDARDEAQTVPMPKIGTTAKVDGAKEATESTQSRIEDEIKYENLTPGRTYYAEAVLMDKETGKSTGISGKAEFTPKTADGTAVVSFTADTSAFAGKKLVAFEKVYSENENKERYLVTAHEDIKDENQTILINRKPKNNDNGKPPVSTGDDLSTAELIARLAAILLLAAVGIILMRRRKRLDV